MLIGIPKEIRDKEKRVALVPQSVRELKKMGFDVQVESGAGEAAEYSDATYEAVGAKIGDRAEELWGTSDLLIKVREPKHAELEMLKDGATLISFFWPAENEKDLETLKKLSIDLNCKHYEINFEERKTLHLAAIISNNFTNFLFGISKEIIDSKNLDFNILKPLINETVNKIHKLDPYESQTGPARRNDKNIIDMQIKMLKDPDHQNLYKLISQMIKRNYDN